MFVDILNQEGEILNEKFIILDNSSVLYISESKWVVNYKDGHSIEQAPWAMQYLFKKIDGKWKVLYGAESGSEKIVVNPEKSKEVNQIELHKQFIGTWKGEEGKDTICVWEVKPYGTGLDCYFQYISKGKMFMDGKQLWGYDKKIDKFTMSEMVKGMNNALYSSYFVSNSKCSILGYNDILYPENAHQKFEVNFKSPDTFDQIIIVDNEKTKTVTYQRVK